MPELPWEVKPRKAFLGKSVSFQTIFQQQWDGPSHPVDWDDHLSLFAPLFWGNTVFTSGQMCTRRQVPL